jgi:hypothetical protein
MSRQWSFEVIKLDQIIQVDSIIADRGAYPWHEIDARDWVDPNGMFSIGKSVTSLSTKLIVKNQHRQLDNKTAEVNTNASLSKTLFARFYSFLISSMPPFSNVSVRYIPALDFSTLFSNISGFYNGWIR